VGDSASVRLAESISAFGFRMGRLKTGTPARLVASSVDLSRAAKQLGDARPRPFSFMNDRVWIEPSAQKPCHLTVTTPEVEQIVRDSIARNEHIRQDVLGPR
jgi:tRNA uridine 5-carboxymethylaminomethyl modification enzyme